jgi:hypothetical protein
MMWGGPPLDSPLLYGRVDYTDQASPKFDHWGSIEIVRLQGGPYDGKEAFVFEGWDSVGWEREYIRDKADRALWNYEYDKFL